MPAKTDQKWVVLASGSGTILEAMITRGLKPDYVIVDVEGCRAADIAAAAGIPVHFFKRRGKGKILGDGNVSCDEDRCELTREVRDFIVKQVAPHALVVMAGYMTIFSADMFGHGLMVLNTHPALLPAFKGGTAVADALAAKVKVTGCTIHIATERLDDGPILAQQDVPVKAGDTEETLHERIKVQERRLYSDVVRQVLDGQLDLEAAWRKWQATK